MFKFVGDNLDRKMVVRDIRSDHHGELHHMYSILAVKGRIEPPSSSQDFNCSRLSTIPTSSILPTSSDVSAVQSNLVVLVSKVLCSMLNHCHIVLVLSHITLIMSIARKCLTSLRSPCLMFYIRMKPRTVTC